MQNENEVESVKEVNTKIDASKREFSLNIHEKATINAFDDHLHFQIILSFSSLRLALDS